MGDMNAQTKMGGKLFRSDDGTVVEAEECEGGRVAFWQAGGGFRMAMSKEAFERSFREHVPCATLKHVEVTGEWLPELMTLKALCSEERWNGWVVPHFDLAAGMRLVASMEGQLRYDASEDVFIDMPDGYQTPDRYEGMSVTVNGQQTRVYAIGGRSWCWSLAEAQVAG